MEATLTLPTELVRGRMTLVLISFCIALVLAIGVLGLAYAFFSPPDGPPLASRDLRSGEPFVLRFASNGEDVRLWLDMECDECSFPVDGSMRLSRGGEVFTDVEIQTGDANDEAWGGHSRSLEDQLLLDAPAQPGGAEVIASGTLTVHEARDSLSGSYIEGAPPPKIRVFRLTVTN